MTAIVLRAICRPIVSVGQLSCSDVRALNLAVKHGHLSKGKGGPYPTLKTVWSFPGFDFAADRRMQVSRMLSSGSCCMKAGRP